MHIFLYNILTNHLVKVNKVYYLCVLIRNMKVGDIVKWCWSETHQNTYIIILIDDKGALLKQNFGRGTTLSEAKKDRVPLTELEKI